VAPAANLVLVNRVDTDNGRSVRGPKIWELAEMILDARTGSAKAGPAMTDVKVLPLGPVLPAPRELSEIALDAARLSDVLGDWEQETEPKMRVTVHTHEGRLFALAKGQGETELFTDAPDSYFSRAANVRFVVRRGPTGEVTHGELTFNSKTSRLRKANN